MVKVLSYITVISLWLSYLFFVLYCLLLLSITLYEHPIKSSIPFLAKKPHQHDKNEYTNANSLRETLRVIPHNSCISYIK